MKTPRPADPWDPAHPPRTSDTAADRAHPESEAAPTEHAPASKPIPIAGIRPRL